MIHVIATITVRPGKRDALLRAFHANLPSVRAEAGCIDFGAGIDAQGPNEIQVRLGDDTLVLVEKWVSIEALQAHLAAPHMVSYFAATKELIANAVVHVLSPV